jgi:hypothetical protein
MEKIVGQFEKCDECEALIDVYIEFYSRRGDIVKVCMNCMCEAITKVTAGEICRTTNHLYIDGKCAHCGQEKSKE